MRHPSFGFGDLTVTKDLDRACYEKAEELHGLVRIRTKKWLQKRHEILKRRA